jgi:AcrR family transcriptional regulator
MEGHVKKQPRQHRSRDMVATLLEAAAQEIAARGLAETTTNHVAARAGVSIGSLYQYFDDKDAIIEELLRRDTARLLAVVDAHVGGLLDADPRQLTRTLLEIACDAIEANPTQRELARNWQSLRSHAAFVTLEQRLTEISRRYILRHHQEYRIEDLPAALFVGIHAMLYTVAHFMSLEDPPITRAQMITSLTDMLSASLFASRDMPPIKRKKPVKTARKRRT